MTGVQTCALPISIDLSNYFCIMFLILCPYPLPIQIFFSLFYHVTVLQFRIFQHIHSFRRYHLSGLFPGYLVLTNHHWWTIQCMNQHFIHYLQVIGSTFGRSKILFCRNSQQCGSSDILTEILIYSICGVIRIDLQMVHRCMAGPGASSAGQNYWSQSSYKKTTNMVLVIYCLKYWCI